MVKIKCNTTGCDAEIDLTTLQPIRDGWKLLSAHWYCPTCSDIIVNSYLKAKDKIADSMRGVDNWNKFVVKVAHELIRADKLYPDFHSAHEGFAVIGEEIGELWDCVRSNDPGPQFKEELVQIAAMCAKMYRYIENRTELI